jgi:hypothetical protein
MSNSSSGARLARRASPSTPVEVRIVNLVAAVLASAGAGCGGEPSPVRGVDPARTVDAVDTARAPIPTATASEVAEPVGTTPASSFPEGDPRAVCATYRDKVASDPNGPKFKVVTEQTPDRARKADVDGVRQPDGTIQCHIVWERLVSSRLILVAPTCCPQAMGNEPCPPATLQPFRVERSKAQRVVLDGAGNVVSDTLA